MKITIELDSLDELRELRELLQSFVFLDKVCIPGLPEHTDELPLENRVRNVLNECGLTDVRRIAAMSDLELTSHPGLGREALRQIRLAISSFKPAAA